MEGEGLGGTEQGVGEGGQNRTGWIEQVLGDRGQNRTRNRAGEGEQSRMGDRVDRVGGQNKMEGTKGNSEFKRHRAGLGRTEGECGLNGLNSSRLERTM